MKFEAGKSYRLIDPDGFKSQSPMSETYFNVRKELSEAKIITCLRVNENGAIFDFYLYILCRERKYFEEI